MDKNFFFCPSFVHFFSFFNCVKFDFEACMSLDGNNGQKSMKSAKR